MQSRLRRIKPPIVGTYRFTITFDALERTYYARTYPTPNSAFTLVDQSPPADPTFVARPAGYYMIVAGSLVRDSLPRDCERGRRPDKEGYIVLLDDPPAVTPRGKEWRGKIEMDLITRVFPEDSAIRHFALAEFEQLSRRRRGNMPTETPALFIERPDGTLHVEQEIGLDDGRGVRIHGNRLSLESVVCSW
ncbi:MAG TPA: hypothetical protein VFZ04_14440 [Longimicrobiales bacterium]